MQFYKFEGIITNPDWTEENDKRHILRERARKICLKTTTFQEKREKGELQKRDFVVSFGNMISALEGPLWMHNRKERSPC